MSPATTLTELRQRSDNRDLVRKIRRSVAFLGRVDDVELPEQITTEDHRLINLAELGWLAFGLVNRDGYEFGRDIEKSQTDALGYGDPVRRDVENVARNITTTLLEHGKRHIHELVDGADYSGIRPKENGEIVWDEPDLPLFEKYRMIIIGEDGRITENWLMGRGYGSVELETAQSITWNHADATAQAITLSVDSDPAIGSPVRNYLGGSAIGKYTDVLGWNPETPAPAPDSGTGDGGSES
ncbi:hypothetical protein [Nesterenkonia rhizosphaerae]|uniref:Uncharacterized protein n=1 Tax=Nesterenkonia rhizosphaerae TaxID=1348272 RepID=A0ABP9G0R5_9MICC